MILVNTRNAASILAAISESSVSGFKDVCFEYIYRNLDTMLETHVLDEFDDYLMHELDEAVKARQLAYMPTVRSGRMILDLINRNPQLAGTTEAENASILRLMDMAIANVANADLEISSSPSSYRPSSSFRAASYEKHKRRRSSKSGPEMHFKKTPPFAPLHGSDLIFDMEDEEGTRLSKTPVSHSPAIQRNRIDALGTTNERPEVWYDRKGKQIADKVGVSGDTSLASPIDLGQTSKNTWVSGMNISEKLDMKEIMVQASKNRTSNLSLGLSATNTLPSGGVDDIPSGAYTAPITTKISQKERKKQQQQQVQSQQKASVVPPSKTPTPEKPKTPASPWKTIRTQSSPLSLNPDTASPTSPPQMGSVAKLLDVFSTPPKPQQVSTSTSRPSPRVVSSGTPKKSNQTASPQVQTRRYNSSGEVLLSPGTTPSNLSSQSIQPRSERYDEFPPIGARAEQLQLPLAEIIQEEQIRQDVIKGKGPKQSLQEIQQEQEFLDWWNKESERLQQEEFERQLLSQGEKSRKVQAKEGRRPRGRGRGNLNTPSSQNFERDPAKGLSEKDAVPFHSGPGRGSLQDGRGRGRGRGRGVKSRHATRTTDAPA